MPSNWRDNSWHHVAYVHPQDAWGLEDKFYFDGVLLTTGSSTGAWVERTTTWRIGQNLSSNLTTNGAIDEVRIYNRALTADEVKRLYLMGR